ncbi:ATP-dependent nuclease [Mammaliicoccus sciuri]|uniref:ATP-dependent nuclease n=1 Tax=Mammaliicoccus sciuri TaxID=1296 RepID=UPI001FB23847|nr:AAA family ATPase [Mammaliicoccus sciuri]MCJ0916140.1 AAA family ATPase [Mammaliicoccus sciuri]MCJ0936839.1 AAA family ATPase [Mammaliicoccus sciuri]
MKIINVRIHNYRSIINESFNLDGYNLLVGANNSGKSTVVNAILTFYEKIKYNVKTDFPKVGSDDNEAWIEITYQLNDEEFNELPDGYKSEDRKIIIRKLLFSEDKNRFSVNQSNLYAVINGELEENLFFGAKNVGKAKLGEVIYIPAVSNVADNLKMTGPSPLRDTINYLFKEVVQEHSSYKNLTTSFSEFNKFANEENGVFNSIVNPLNKGIEEWDISFKLQINPISPEEITKNLISYHFNDGNLSDEEVNINQYGHGFQRAIIFNLIKLSASLKKEKKVPKKEFNPKLVILLFEEPEAFLHPTQQEQLFYNLKTLAKEQEYQVLLTSHSSLFIGKATEKINQIIRINKIKGCSKLYQPTQEALNDFFDYAMTFKQILDGTLDEDDDKELVIQEEQFRYQLWLDSERSSMFFANHVIITEGATEKVLIDYLLDNKWADLKKYKLYVLDSMGKYNVHRYMKLLCLFGIKHSVFIDSDSNTKKQKSLEKHKKIHEHINNCCNEYTVNEPYLIDPDIEGFLNLPMPRKDRKPLDMIIALTSNKVSDDKIKELKSIFIDLINDKTGKL